jgi:hypothetical protein
MKVLKAPERSFTISSILANSSAVCFGFMAISPTGDTPFGVAFTVAPALGVSSSGVSREVKPALFIIVYIPLIV